MFKKIILGIILIIAITGIGYWIFWSQKEADQPTGTQTFTLNLKNCAYVIDGKNITLTNGYSEEASAPGSASKIITRYFGNEVPGDFNNDGIRDAAFILTQDTGGSGTFYYVAVALGNDNKCNGTNAILLGDRIAPQTTEFQNGEIIVNYAKQKPNEPMTASPSVGVSKYFRIDGGKLAEVSK